MYPESKNPPNSGAVRYKSPTPAEIRALGFDPATMLPLGHPSLLAPRSSRKSSPARVPSPWAASSLS
jgi:hypothetical protein